MKNVSNGVNMKKIICKIFGHRSICLFRSNNERSEWTAWKCERCGDTFCEQWDT